MGTRSHVGIEHADGTVEYIYTHWDGDVESLGITLMGFYYTPEKLQALINLGDCSTVGPSPELCESYHRDKGEDWDDVKPAVVDSRAEFLADSEEYMYMMTVDGHLLVRGGGHNCLLAEATDEIVNE